MNLKRITEKADLISIDTRQIKRGGIFIAIKGERYDGHDFVEKAFKKGADSAIVSRSVPLLRPELKKRLIRVKDTRAALGEIAKFHRSKFNIPVIAITGSNGKTTTKDMLSFVLAAKYTVLKSKASRNNLLGLGLTLLGLEKKHRIAVVEMGMNHPGEIDRLCKIAMPTAGIITNIAPAHLEFLGTTKNIFRAKSELLNNLPRGGVAVLNKDDRYLSGVGRLNARKIYFGVEKKCRFRAKGIFRRDESWFFSLEKEGSFKVALLGRHNIYNALASIALSGQFGMAYPDIKERLGLYSAAPRMRLEVKNIHGTEILDDTYNSNPASMRCAIDALAAHDTKGRKIVVAGDMAELGKNEEAMHESVGTKIAGSSCDILVTLGNLSQFIGKGAKKNGMAGSYHAKSHTDAAKFLKAVTRPGDAILVKGSRAMRMEKIIKSFTALQTA